MPVSYPGQLMVAQRRKSRIAIAVDGLDESRGLSGSLNDNALLSLRQVATILQVSEPRIYQMDAILKPVVTRRGKKNKLR